MPSKDRPQPVEITAIMPVLYGIQVDGQWWTTPDGVVFHTPHLLVAQAQARLLIARSVPGVQIKVEKYE